MKVRCATRKGRKILGILKTARIIGRNVRDRFSAQHFHQAKFQRKHRKKRFRTVSFEMESMNRGVLLTSVSTCQLYRETDERNGRDILSSMEQRSRQKGRKLPNNNRWIGRFRRKYASPTFLASVHAVPLTKRRDSHSQLSDRFQSFLVDFLQEEGNTLTAITVDQLNGRIETVDRLEEINASADDDELYSHEFSYITSLHSVREESISFYLRSSKINS